MKSDYGLFNINNISNFRDIDSNILSPLNKVWFIFGLFLGKYISPVVMMLIYFIICYSYWIYDENIEQRYIAT